MAVSDYSTTPDENVTISGINIAEGCAPSGINNAIRQMMADIKTEATSKASSISTVAADLATEVARAQAAEAGYLPLSGGTMSGAIELNGIDTFIKQTDTAHALVMQGGTTTENGAGVYLYGGDQNSDGGYFRIRASYSNGTYKDLLGKPSGSLTYNGQPIERIYSSGSGFVRYASGVQLCWGTVVFSSEESSVSYPAVFSVTPWPVAVGGDWGGATAYSCSVRYQSTTGFSIIQHDGTYPGSGAKRFDWIAIGYWEL